MPRHQIMPLKTTVLIQGAYCFKRDPRDHHASFKAHSVISFTFLSHPFLSFLRGHFILCSSPSSYDATVLSFITIALFLSLRLVPCVSLTILVIMFQGVAITVSNLLLSKWATVASAGQHALWDILITMSLSFKALQTVNQSLFFLVSTQMILNSMKADAGLAFHPHWCTMCLALLDVWLCTMNEWSWEWMALEFRLGLTTISAATIIVQVSSLAMHSFKNHNTTKTGLFYHAVKNPGRPARLGILRPFILSCSIWASIYFFSIQSDLERFLNGLVA